MTQLRNIREIAAAAGVSVATVSRTLKGGKEAAKVSEATRRNVLSICEKHRYHPNQNTVRMLSGRANAVAFLAPPDLLFPPADLPTVDLNLTAALGGAAQELAESNMYLTLAPVSQRFLDESEYLRLVRGKLVDGLLIWGWIDGQDYLPNLVKEGTPTVMIQTADPTTPLDQVIADDRLGMRLVVDHLVELGHRRIGYILPPMTSMAGRERDRGVRDALAAHGLAPAATSRTMAFDIAPGEVAAHEVFDAASDITALIASNDQAAVGAMRAATARGLRIPYDVSITGADGLTAVMPQPLTTYVTPAAEIGRQGVRLLLERIASAEHDLQRVVKPVSLRVGATTAPPHVGAQ